MGWLDHSKIGRGSLSRLDKLAMISRHEFNSLQMTDRRLDSVVPEQPNSERRQ